MTVALAPAPLHDQPHAPWCRGDCDGRIHERHTAIYNTEDVDDKATLVTFGVEVDNGTGDTRAVLRMQRADRPTRISRDDIARLTAHYDNDTCRHMLAEYIAGVWTDQTAVIPVEHLTGFADAIRAARIYAQGGHNIRAGV